MSKKLKITGAKPWNEEIIPSLSDYSSDDDSIANNDKQSQASNEYDPACETDNQDSQEIDEAAGGSGNKRSEKSRNSRIWNFFERRIDGNSSECQICHMFINSRAGNTSSMRKHLQYKHIGEFSSLKESEKASDPKRQTTMEEFSKPTLYLPSHPKAIAITKSIGRMIPLDYQPFSVVEDPGFIDVIYNCDPKYKIPSRTTFSRKVIPELYSNLMNDIKLDIDTAIEQKVQSLSFTCDFWSSRAMDSYLSLTCHFTTNNFESKLITLACLPFYQRHSADNIQSAIQEYLQTLIPLVDLERIPIYVVTDNAPNIKKAIMSSTWTHVPCFCHSLQLVVESIIEKTAVEGSTLNDLLTKCRSIVGHFKHSVNSDRRLDEAQVELFKIPLSKAKKLVQDCKTRWNSQYYMLQRLYELRQPLVQALSQAKFNNRINSYEWVIIKSLIDVLEPFEIATRDLSAELYPTINLVYPALHFIERQQLKLSAGPQYIDTDLANKVLEALRHRFPDYKNERLYLVSMVLDPRIKMVLLKPDEKTIMATLLKSEFTPYTVNEGCNVQEDNEEPKKAMKTKKPGIWKSIYKKSQETVQNHGLNLSASDQVNVYLEESVESDDCNIMNYWKEKAGRFPFLAMLAKKYLSIPASSAASERMFSGTGNIVTTRRASLLPEHVQQLTVLHENLKRQLK